MGAPAPHGLPGGGDSTASATSQGTNNSPDMKISLKGLGSFSYNIRASAVLIRAQAWGPTWGALCARCIFQKQSAIAKAQSTIAVRDLIHGLGCSIFQPLYTCCYFLSLELPYIMFHNDLCGDSMPVYEDITNKYWLTWAGHRASYYRAKSMDFVKYKFKCLFYHLLMSWLGAKDLAALGLSFIICETLGNCGPHNAWKSSSCHIVSPQQL